ncbi:hypothetical protein [Gracilimonas sp. BCB1]|uniref:hypothetical protein n=1 Tax=Gracilimonas sp. BCB1 TaxID=3152362 RepID=UPI003F853A61
MTKFKDFDGLLIGERSSEDKILSVIAYAPGLIISAGLSSDSGLYAERLDSESEVGNLVFKRHLIRCYPAN